MKKPWLLIVLFLIVGGIYLIKKPAQKSGVKNSADQKSPSASPIDNTNGKKEVSKASPTSGQVVFPEASGNCVFILPSVPAFDEKSKAVKKVDEAFSDNGGIRIQKLTMTDGKNYSYAEVDCNGVLMKLKVTPFDFSGDRIKKLQELFKSPELTKRGKYFMSHFEKYLDAHQKLDWKKDTLSFFSGGSCAIELKGKTLTLSRDFHPPRQVIENIVKNRK